MTNPDRDNNIPICLTIFGDRLGCDFVPQGTRGERALRADPHLRVNNPNLRGLRGFVID